MPKKTHNELLAGVFVVLALAALMGVVLWLGATDMFKQMHQRAAFYVEESQGSVGLERGNAVLVNDRVVGKIGDIRPGGNGRTLYFADIEAAEAAPFYRTVGRLGRLLIDIETQAFALPT